MMGKSLVIDHEPNHTQVIKAGYAYYVKLDSGVGPLTRCKSLQWPMQRHIHAVLGLGGCTNAPSKKP